MTNEVTNVVSITPHLEIQNNAWTLLKHAASSANKAAGKVDAKVYGPIVNAASVQLPPQRREPLPKHDTSFFTIVINVLVGVAVAAAAVAIFFAWCAGHIKGRDLIGF